MLTNINKITIWTSNNEKNNSAQKMDIGPSTYS